VFGLDCVLWIRAMPVISNPSTRLRMDSVRDLSERFLGFASK
jgi:hypothetical protein